MRPYKQIKRNCTLKKYDAFVTLKKQEPELLPIYYSLYIYIFNIYVLYAIQYS